MAIHVGELVSEVVPEPEDTVAVGSSSQSDERDKLRALQEQLRRDALRTQAEAYGD